MESELEARLIAAECLLHALLATHPHPDVLKTLLTEIGSGITAPRDDGPDRAAVVHRAQEVINGWVSSLDVVLQPPRSAG
jgi:hypothetical protein